MCICNDLRGFALSRHLTKLPEKSFKVAEGDVVGGLVHVMDKPIGIEEGMVGMSIDSPAYRQYIKSVLSDLDAYRNGAKPKPELEKLFERYSKIVKFDSFQSFNNLLPKEQEFLVDLMLHDPKIPEYLENLKKQSRSKKAEKSVAALDKLVMAGKLLNLDLDNLPKDGILRVGPKDNPYKKHRYGPSWNEAKKVLFSTGKLHEVKAGQAYYVNEGMGGLLFQNYKNKCGIDEKNDHFAVKIQKFINGGKANPSPDETNKVYMVKQDGEMVLGGTGPGWNKMMKTTMGKSFQFLANPFVVIASGGLLGLAYGAIMLGWRSFYLRKNKPTSANSDAIVESLATKLAQIRGMETQEINTIEGTYADGSPKIATIVTWTPGCRDLSGRLSGGESELSSVVLLQTEDAERYKVSIIEDDEGNRHEILLREIKKKGEVIGYEKMDKDGKNITPATKKEFNAAYAISDDRIVGFGESLIGMISMGDHDGIGKKGQNKAIAPLIPPQDPQIYQFYGIDFGKAYQKANPIIASLSDDFSFNNPTNKRKRFSNYSMLYDNPLSEKMKGVYLLAALRGGLTDPQKEKIAADYEARGDKAFATKLLGYPPSMKIDELLMFISEQKQKYQQLLEKNPQDTKLQQHFKNLDDLYEKVSQTKDKSLATAFFSYPAAVGGVNSDLALIKAEEEKYRQLADEAEKNGDLKKRDEFQSYAARVEDVHKIAQANDRHILGVFKQRIGLTPTQIDVLENLEKLTSKQVTTLSPDGKVVLNHIRVEPKGRFKWQIDHEGNLVSDAVSKENKDEIRTRFSELIQQLAEQLKKEPQNQQLIGLISVLKATQTSIKAGDKIKINNVGDPSLVTLLAKHVTESTIAKTRPEIKTFRTLEQRNDFHKMIKKYEQTKAAQKETNKVDQKPQVKSSPPIKSEQRRSHTLQSTMESSRIRTNSAPPKLTSTRAKIVTPLFTHRQEAEELTPSLQKTVGQSGLALHKLHAYISDYDKEMKEKGENENGIHRLKIPLDGLKHLKMGENEALELPFENENGKIIKAFAQDSPAHQGIVYSTAAGLDMKNEKDRAEFEFSARQICLLAVMNAQPNTEFDFSVAPIEKQPILKKAFEEAVKIAIGNSAFTEENRPIIKGEDPSSKIRVKTQ